MVARFVAVDISAEQAFSCHIFGLGEEFIRQMHGKQGVQLVDKTAVSTHQANQIGRSLRNIERVVPGISLDKTLSVCAEQIDLLFPATVFVTRTGKTETGFEHVPVVEGTFLVSIGNLLVSQQKGGVIDRPVFIGILQRDGGGSGGLVERNIS